MFGNSLAPCNPQQPAPIAAPAEPLQAPWPSSPARPFSLSGKSFHGKLLLLGCSNVLLSLLLAGETEAWICTVLHREMLGSAC